MKKLPWPPQPHLLTELQAVRNSFPICGAPVEISLLRGCTAPFEFPFEFVGRLQSINVMLACISPEAAQCR